MAQYQTKLIERAAIQLAISQTPTDIALYVMVHGIQLSVLKDALGPYVSVNTKTGTALSREDQWIVKLTDTVAAVPSVPNIQATGSFTVSGTATGDGLVGFSWNATNYVYAPSNGELPDDIATALSVIINNELHLTLVSVVGPVINVQANYTIVGTFGNLPMTDISTDSTSSGTPVGLSGGQDYIPGVPEVPATFEVLFTDDFNEKYELVP